MNADEGSSNNETGAEVAGERAVLQTSEDSGKAAIAAYIITIRPSSIEVGPLSSARSHKGPWKHNKSRVATCLECFVFLSSMTSFACPNLASWSISTATDSR